MTAESGGPERRLDVRRSGRLVLRQALLSGGRLSSRSFKASRQDLGQDLRQGGLRATSKQPPSVKPSVKASIKAAVWQRTPENAKC